MIRTIIYWNNGKPSIGPRTLPSDVNPTSIDDDAWVYMYCKPPLVLAGWVGLESGYLNVNQWRMACI